MIDEVGGLIGSLSGLSATLGCWQITALAWVSLSSDSALGSQNQMQSTSLYGKAVKGGSSAVYHVPPSTCAENGLVLDQLFTEPMLHRGG